MDRNFNTPLFSFLYTVQLYRFVTVKVDEYPVFRGQILHYFKNIEHFRETHLYTVTIVNFPRQSNYILSKHTECFTENYREAQYTVKFFHIVPPVIFSKHDFLDKQEPTPAKTSPLLEDLNDIFPTLPLSVSWTHVGVDIIEHKKQYQGVRYQRVSQHANAHSIAKY